MEESIAIVVGLYVLVGLGYYTSLGGNPSWREHSFARAMYAAFWFPALVAIGTLTLVGIGDWLRGSVE